MRADPLQNSWLYAVALMGAVVIGTTLYVWGQPLICACGEVRFWVGSIFSSENSQQIADWYTLSHIVHGLLVVLFGRLLVPSLGFPWLFATAIGTGVAWEIVEHSDFVLDQFRATTLYQGYLGDSILNAVSDYLWMLCGFLFASMVRTVWVVAAVLCLEVLAASVARDSLVLTTLMLVYPSETIESWQQEINPQAGSGE